MERLGLIGKKMGMTQVFENGVRIPVTVVQIGPNVVVQKKTPESKDGYSAIQVGFDEVEHRKVSKAMQGHYGKADLKPRRKLQEFRLPDVSEFEVGKELPLDMFAEGEFIDVSGTTKGKGFQGVVRRHGMKGAKQATHGTHEQFRHVGSIGCRSTPGEVHKGKRLPGHMGVQNVTTQNVRVVKVDTENQRVLVRGSVPGSRNAYVVLRKCAKKPGKIAPVA